MSECNCCCAYLSPPWWVTMGYAPAGAYMPTVNTQPPSPPNSQPPTPPNSQPLAPPPAGTPPNSVVVTAPPPAVQPTPPRVPTTPAGPQANPAAGVARIVGDMATGNVIGALGDALTLL